VLVQGDTTTVMASTIAAHHRRIGVGHVEAGLRSFDRANPFPEEMNRVVADHVSDLHFVPTATARRNLLAESIQETSIWLTGNTVIDSLLHIASRSEMPSDESLRSIAQSDRPIVMVTAHRRENHGRPLQHICDALRRLACSGAAHIVYPVHLNPKVWEPVHRTLADEPHVTLLPPLDYADLVWLMQRAAVVLTDSGGIQEEAPALGKPVLVLREVTERPEGIETGTAKLVGTDPDGIVAETRHLLEDEDAYQAMANAVSPYGDGRASRRIADVLLTGRCQPFEREESEADGS
jgi:UDP-N-acetylglucosamine 2-epimerase (non-hydrolysing)